VPRATPPLLAHAGTIFVKWRDQCKHFGWGDPKKLCGPVINSMVKGDVNCPCDHPPGCAEHRRPMVEGKEFDIRNYKGALEAAGITQTRQELKDDVAARRKPPGQPKMTNGYPVYAARHFQ
jgi:hypothetical protein